MTKNDINNILIPIDFSKAAKFVIDEAMTLAKLVEAEVQLLYVKEFYDYNPFQTMPDSPMENPTAGEVKKRVVAALEEMKSEIANEYGITPKAHIAEGDVHEEIVEFAEKNNVDLIAMGTHGVSGYREMFVGSNAQRVVTLSDLPVLTVSIERNKPDFNNILIPIDDSLHSREKVNIAVMMASLYKAKVHIVGVFEPEEPNDINKFKIKLKSVEDIIKKHNLEMQTEIIESDSLAESTLEYAEKHKCDLIVINTGHESKITGIFLGLFAQQIVNHSKVPVLSLKHSPSHFSIVTPGFGVS